MDRGSLVVNNSGFTLMEIIIVTVIASMLIYGGTSMYSQTTRRIQKNSEALQAQAIVQSISKFLRNDLRSLFKIDIDECDENKFTFYKEQDSILIKVQYEFDSQNRLIVRHEGDLTKNLAPKNKIRNLCFIPQPSLENFHFLNLAAEVVTSVTGKEIGRESSLPIITQFFSNCKKEYTPLEK